MLSDILDTFADPITRHAALVHLPIAIAILGVPLCVIAAIVGHRPSYFRWTALTAYLLMAVVAWQASEAGEAAMGSIGNVTAEVHELADLHEQRGDAVPKLAFGLFILLLFAGLPKEKVAASCAWLAAAGSVGLMAYTGYVAHLGGRLVYDYGVNTPDLVTEERKEAAARATIVNPPGEDSPPSDDARVVFFRETVYPILEDNCIGCHNPTKVSRNKAGALDQTTRGGLIRGGHSGPAIVPGKPEESLLITAVRHEDDYIMPPDEKLPDKDIAALERWIRDGAVWE